MIARASVSDTFLTDAFAGLLAFLLLGAHATLLLEVDRRPGMRRMGDVCWGGRSCQRSIAPSRGNRELPGSAPYGRFYRLTVGRRREQPLVALDQVGG